MRGDRVLQVCHVAHVAVPVERLGVPAPGQRLGERAPRVVLHVHEADPHALGGELGDELGAEAGRTTADERHLAAQARVRGELGHPSASASRSTWSGIRVAGEEDQLVAARRGERPDVLAHGLGVGGGPRDDRVRVVPGTVVVAQAVLDRLLGAGAEGVVRLRQRPRRAVAPGGVPRRPQARGPVGELLQRAVAAGPAGGMARGAGERGVRPPAEQDRGPAVHRSRTDPPGRAEVLAVPDPVQPLEHLVEDRARARGSRRRRLGSRPRGALRPRRARGARPTARRAWRPAWRAARRWPAWGRGGSRSRAGSAR